MWESLSQFPWALGALLDSLQFPTSNSKTLLSPVVWFCVLLEPAFLEL